MTPFSAVIFDMDGLLINSEELWDTADVLFFEKRSIPLTYELKRTLMGKSLHQGAEWIKTQFGLPDSVESIVAERTKNTDTIYTQLATPMPGVEPLLQRLAEKNIPLAIGSGSSINRIDAIVDRLNWRHYFSVLASSDHVNYRGKPEPDIYLYTAEKLGVSCVSCVVFEDSVNGVIAAKSAQMSCVAVPAPEANREDFLTADMIVSSLQEPTIYSFLGI